MFSPHEEKKSPWFLRSFLHRLRTCGPQAFHFPPFHSSADLEKTTGRRRLPKCNTIHPCDRCRPTGPPSARAQPSIPLQGHMLSHSRSPVSDSFASDDLDTLPQPSFEQVARSMARSLRFAAPCRHMQEHERQIDEGRKMTRAEFDNASRREPRAQASEPTGNPRHAQGPHGLDQPPRHRSRNRRHRNREQAAA